MTTDSTATADSELPTHSDATAEKTSQETPVHGPDASLLEDRMPDWARLSRQAIIWTVLLGVAWMVFNYQRLWHTDLWGHLEYGRVIVNQKSIPATEPLLPLCRGVPFNDTAWLTQVLGFLMYEQFGVTSMRLLHAVALMACVVALLLRFRERTFAILPALAGLFVFGLISWKSLSIVRPQLAGYACFVILFSLVTHRKWPRSFWLLIPLLFMTWANLHGSFPMGFILIGLMAIGTGIDVGFRSGSLRAIWRNRRLRQLIGVCQLSILATLINPYGIKLWLVVSEFSNNPNLTSLVEWNPLTLHMIHGQQMAIVAVLLVMLYRFTPRRISAMEPLLLIIFSLAGMWSVRLLVWWAPIAAWFAFLHGQAIIRHKFSLSNPKEPVPTAGFNTLIVLGLAWIFFGFTPFATTLLHGYPQNETEAQRFYRSNLGRQTPVLLTEYLKEHPPQGLVFNIYEWGDYLLWAGPENIQLFLNSHAHLIPHDVWLDYLLIANANDGWRDKLDRYGVNTVVIDDRYRSRLIGYLNRDEDWELDYQDDLGAIFRRVVPIENQPRRLINE